MTEVQRTENLARRLRTAAFPGASLWASVHEDVRKRWIRVGSLADSLIERARDEALLEATAKAHENGLNEVAKMLREMRKR